MLLLMNSARYSARIGEAHCIGVSMPYETLLVRIMEFTVRAAIAKVADESEWEHERLRRNGLAALQVSRNGKALWDNAKIFDQELAAAQRGNAAKQFRECNVLDPEFFARLDRDLGLLWRRLGYEAGSLRGDMKALFSELEHDAADRAAQARERLLADFCSVLQEMV